MLKRYSLTSSFNLLENSNEKLNNLKDLKFDCEKTNSKNKEEEKDNPYEY